MFADPSEPLYYRDYRIKANVDTLPVKYLLGAGCAACVYMLIILIVGMTGPHAHIQWDTYSFVCDGELEYDYHDNCTGTNMGETGDAGREYLFLPPLGDPNYEMKRSNYQFSLQIWPYNKEYRTTTSTLKKDLDVHYMLFGTNEKNHGTRPDVNGQDGLWTLIHDKTEEENLYCPKNKPDCYGFILFLQRVIDFKYYSIMVEFLPSDGKDYVDNVLWVESTQSQTFNDLQLGFRLTYFFISLFVVGLMVVPLRHKHIREWPFEQRAVLVLAGGLCFFNNPFFGIELVSNSWIFPFLDSVFQSILVCLLFMYWFFVLDNIRATEMEPAGWVTFLKAGVVLLYGVLEIILASWVDTRFSVNPAIGSGEITGIITLFYMTSCLFGCLVVWLIVLAVLTIPVAFSKPYLKIRFIYLSLPASVVCFSLLIGIFVGTYGPYDRSTVSFLYFYALFNVYIYLLVFGFYPSMLDLSTGVRANMEDFVSPEQISIINNDKQEAMSMTQESAVSSLSTMR